LGNVNQIKNVTSQKNVLNTLEMVSQAVHVTGLKNLKNVNQIAQKNVVLKNNLKKY
jgi:hypothetical protein